MGFSWHSGIRKMWARKFSFLEANETRLLWWRAIGVHITLNAKGILLIIIIQQLGTSRRKQNQTIVSIFIASSKSSEYFLSQSLTSWYSSKRHQLWARHVNAQGLWETSATTTKCLSANLWQNQWVICLSLTFRSHWKT